MKLVSFRKDGRSAYGIVEGEGIVDAHARFGGDHPTLRSLLDPNGLKVLAALAGASQDVALASVELLPVVPDPQNIFCIGVNYMSHLIETGRPKPDHPMVFLRVASSQLGHLQPMVRPDESEQLDFEGELAVVIGKGGRRIAKADALDHVAGYACYNDGSIRDWQKHTTQFAPGKNFDRTGAFGPWLVTSDEIGDPSTLNIWTRLNGEVMQQAPLSDLVFDIPTLIAYLSSFATLSPGDVIVTGTTGGVGAFRTPQLWMKPGDVVEIEVDRIGVLRNPIVQG
ncbi:fumarylacetoacetate hydrolase family protein [Aminobacter aganoensis]|uniref:2-keto-4-pentenoate hydratase/2-oxohepta-3-ene-1,7-dioic acid hydratase in catechol pathway n=1 Tax=Aminobacter aganoensis TaxID=83264 RepID=A0A7X0FB63_9HYPH|nr:fumarylacetoacetate hydrolase family protein [Aminobacter aganoensis]MBB6356482.1 2-keto-4-pentenoate hydratase/2-oxohepta-3-ene-1,7-dioic acid hydratase in catechol pathway [Aminobacter aganoensis]